MERRPLLACGFGLLALAFLAGAWRFAAVGPGAEALAGSALSTSMVAVSLAMAGALLRRTSLQDALGLKTGHIGLGRLGIVALGAIGLSHLCGEVLRRTSLFEESFLQHLEVTLTGLNGNELMLAAAGLVIAPAIGEELLFRGLLLRGLLPRVGPASAILVSSILFGAAHIDPGQVIATSLLGVYLGVLAFASGSTRGAIACHMLNNAVALASVSLGQPDANETGTSPPVLEMVLAGLAALAGGLVLAGVLRRVPRGRPDRDELSS